MDRQATLANIDPCLHPRLRPPPRPLQPLGEASDPEVGPLRQVGFAQDHRAALVGRVQIVP
jgi:hypothetical protein